MRDFTIRPQLVPREAVEHEPFRLARANFSSGVLFESGDQANSYFPGDQPTEEWYFWEVSAWKFNICEAVRES